LVFFRTSKLIGVTRGFFRITGQHESILIIRQNGEIDIIDTDELGFPLGLINDITEHCKEIQLEINCGDTMILYTDGVTEAVNNVEEFYGMERFLSACKKTKAKTADGIKEELISDIKNFIGDKNIYDDISLVVLKQC